MKRIRAFIQQAGPGPFALSALLLVASLAVSGGGLYVTLAAPLNTPYTPAVVSFEGQLADSAGNPVPDSPPAYTVTFNLYDEASGTHNPLWSETQTVTVSQGVYNVLLGSVTPLQANAFDGARWLGVKVGSDAEITPRIPISAVPYALNARQALGLQSYPLSSTTPLDNQLLTFSSGQWAPANPASVPSVRAYGNANIALANGTTPVVVALNAERWDSTGTMHDNTTNNSRLTAPVAGKYLITANVSITNTSLAGQRAAQILWTSGSTNIVIAYDTRNASTNSCCSGPVRINLSTVYHLSAGDYVTLRVWQNSGSAMTINGNVGYSPELAMTRVGD